MRGVPVLMYHALEDAEHPAGAKEPGEQLYVLQVNQFREQMEYLHRQGYRACLLDELENMEAWPEKAVVLTFDDGHESNYTLALPILLKYGFKAHFFITTGWIGTPNYLTEDQIRELHRRGMGIGSHGVTHRFLSDLPAQEVDSELSVARQRLQEITGGTVCTLSFPGGRMNDNVCARATELGYSLVCSSEPSACKDISPNTPIPRFAISERTSVSDFSSLMLNGESFSKVARYRFLAGFKLILGNRLYERLRGIFLRSFSGERLSQASDER